MAKTFAQTIKEAYFEGWGTWVAEEMFGGMTMNYCEFETDGGPKVEYVNLTAADGTRITEVQSRDWKICGKPARFKFETDTWWIWVCAEHWDHIDDGEDGSFKVPEAAFGRGARGSLDECQATDAPVKVKDV